MVKKFIVEVQNADLLIIHKYASCLTLLMPEFIFVVVRKMPPVAYVFLAKNARPYLHKTHQTCQRAFLRTSRSILKPPESAETLLGHVLCLLAFYINHMPTYGFFLLTSHVLYCARWHFSHY